MSRSNHEQQQSLFIIKRIIRRLDEIKIASEMLLTAITSDENDLDPDVKEFIDFSLDRLKEIDKTLSEIELI